MMLHYALTIVVTDNVSHACSVFLPHTLSLSLIHYLISLPHAIAHRDSEFTHLYMYMDP